MQTTLPFEERKGVLVFLTRAPTSLQLVEIKSVSSNNEHWRPLLAFLFLLPDSQTTCVLVSSYSRDHMASGQGNGGEEWRASEQEETVTFKKVSRYS